MKVVKVTTTDNKTRFGRRYRCSGRAGAHHADCTADFNQWRNVN